MLTLENGANVGVDRGFKRAKELQVQFGSTVAYQRVLGSQGFSSFEHNIHYAKSRIRPPDGETGSFFAALIVPGASARIDVNSD